MAVTLTLSPLVFVREHAHGPCYAFPLASPNYVARGESAEDALEELRDFLGTHLGRCPAGELAGYVFPDEARLEDALAVLPREDLERRLRIEAQVTVPCLVVPDGRAHWVHILPLSHTVYVKPTEDLPRRVVEEIQQAAAARALTAQEYLAVLPTAEHRIERLDCEFERDDAADATKRAATRRRKQGEQKKEAARKLLGTVGVELLANSKARRALAPVIGRDREVRTLASLLSGRERLSVAIVGEPLSGKTAVVHGMLSQEIVRFTARPIFASSGAQLVAGQSGFGQLQQRIDEVMAAAELLDAVLYFDDYGDLFAGHSGSIEDLASMMRPWIVDGRVRVIGELAPDVVEHHEKRHVAFFAAMHRLTVEVADATQTVEILQARIRHETRARPERPPLLPSCVAPLVELSERYLSYQAFPGKAVLLAQELQAVHEGEIGEDGKPRPITVGDVYRAFSVRSGIPMFLLREEHAMRYTEVLEFFARRVIGQREAIEAVAQTLCTVKAGLQPPSKPLANLLFVGPTGVGKTEVAKTLARFLFGGTDKLVRFDMSEYADAYASERLIRGSEREEGELTRKVRQQPFCVLLLDEIEKAHPAVFDLLLQVLGEGRLSDAAGKTTYFHNAIVIMTSNLGAAHRKPQSGFAANRDAAGELSRHYLEQVDRHFRPEFVNRLDRIIPFASLSSAEIAQVARVALRILEERDGLRGRDIELAVSDRALAELATAGYSDVYGARALRRHIEDQLVAPVSRLLAEAGSDGASGSVRVVLAEHEQATAAGELAGGAKLGEAASSALSATLYRGASVSDRGGGKDLRLIASLRRSAATCRELEAVGELRDRAQYLVAELARGGRRSRQPPGASAAEHARLQQSLTAIDDAVEALEGAEDLAAAAVAEGESCEAYVQEAQGAMDRFERAFVRAILGQHAMNEALLAVRAHTNPERLASWIKAFLDGAEGEGWRVLVHRWEDDKPEPPWPTSLPWGPPRSPAWVRKQIDEATPQQIARAWRGALVRVAGAGAGAAMCFEAGLHRFVVEGSDGRDAHLDIQLPKLTFDISNVKLAEEPYALGKPEEFGVLSRTPAVREFDAARGTVTVRGSSVFDIALDDYWAQRERVVFSTLADRLMRGEDALPGEDEWS